jgi:hypothetical protein
MTTLTFENWLSQCHGWIYNDSGIHADYLPDWDYWAAYDDGMKPREAAEAAIDAAKWH